MYKRNYLNNGSIKNCVPKIVQILGQSSIASKFGQFFRILEAPLTPQGGSKLKNY